MFDTAYSPAGKRRGCGNSTKTCEFLRESPQIFETRQQGQHATDVTKKLRANEYYAATERDSNKARRANEDYAANKRDANKARRANEDYAATEKTQTQTNTNPNFTEANPAGSSVCACVAR
jgi:type IV secretory pathway VirB4 component